MGVPLITKLTKIFNIKWAPIHVPLQRRLQTMAAATCMSIVLISEVACILVYVAMLYSRLWWLALIYGFWMITDIDVCNKGGKRYEWVRNLSYWRYYCDYFPMSLVKTVDLNPNRNYILACYPHGIIPQGAIGAFATNALGFYKKFPGMTVNFITLGGNFLVPFFRDFILSLGACSCDENSLMHILDPKKNKGKCAAVVVGGAAEALDSHSGQYKIILRKRKGFVRVAMKSGAPLVPVFSFGEPDAFRPLSNPDNSLLRRFQEKVKKITGISLVLPMGRGLFQYSFGLLPYRCPITIVVGAPIEVKRNLDPTREEIDAVHDEFTKRLVELFESEKKKYLKHAEDIHLELI